MYNVKSLKAEEFISDEEIKETLEYAEANKNNIGLIDAIIEKAKLKKGLTHREASVLLACEIPEKLDEVVNWLMKMDYIPSFCTACYREGRTGDRFMALCKSMQILNCCHPNALMTLKEYLEDYASPQTRELGMKLIDREIEKITNPKVKQTCYEHIHDIADGKRDFRF